jgi:hypothetical protein
LKIAALISLYPISYSVGFRDTKSNSIFSFFKAKATALLAPPVPKINAFLWLFFNNGLIDFLKP